MSLPIHCRCLCNKTDGTIDLDSCPCYRIFAGLPPSLISSVSISTISLLLNVFHEPPKRPSFCLCHHVFTGLGFPADVVESLMSVIHIPPPPVSLPVYARVSAYRRPAGPIQCHRCQDFGHGSDNCYRPLRCVRCGGSHHRTACDKPQGEKGLCCNCGEQHNASYRGCEAFKRARRAMSGPSRWDAAKRAPQFKRRKRLDWPPKPVTRERTPVPEPPQASAELPATEVTSECLITLLGKLAQQLTSACQLLNETISAYKHSQA